MLAVFIRALIPASALPVTRAWALAANGEYEAANAQIQKALQVGVKDPKILLHAGFIAQHLSQTAKVQNSISDKL